MLRVRKMSRFTGVIAILNNIDRWTTEGEQKAADQIAFVHGTLQEIVDNAETNGTAWVIERGKRALREIEHYYE